MTNHERSDWDTCWFLFVGPGDATQQKLEQLIQERRAMENDFSQKRAKFMEMFKQKEGEYKRYTDFCPHFDEMYLYLWAEKITETKHV